MTHHAQNAKDAETIREALAEFRSYCPDYFAEKWGHDEMLNEALRALKRLEAGR